MLTYTIGVIAALFTTASYFPQLRKAWVSRETHDLSLKMLLLLGAGLLLWLAYGYLRQDFVILAANAVSLTMLAGLIYCKLWRSRES